MADIFRHRSRVESHESLQKKLEAFMGSFFVEYALMRLTAFSHEHKDADGEPLSGLEVIDRIFTEKFNELVSHLSPQEQSHFGKEKDVIMACVRSREAWMNVACADALQRIERKENTREDECARIFQEFLVLPDHELVPVRLYPKYKVRIRTLLGIEEERKRIKIKI